MGARVWSGEYTDIPAMGVDPFETTIGYMQDGDVATFKIYDASADQYYDAESSLTEGWEEFAYLTVDFVNAYTVDNDSDDDSGDDDSDHGDDSSDDDSGDTGGDDDLVSGVSLDFGAFDPVTSTIELYYNSDSDISGVQFALSSESTTLISASGGLFDALGFNVVISDDTNILISFSLDGSVIPAGEGVLSNLELETSDGAEICITGSVVSDPSATQLEIASEGCVVIGFAQHRSGDYNDDGDTNVLDIVQLVEIILLGFEPTEYQLLASDMNEDGAINVIDIIQIVNIILEQRASDATVGRLVKKGSMVELESDGYIGAVQLVLSHGFDFSLELTDKAMVADFHTLDNQTTLIIIAPESDELFVTTGEYEISQVLVANSQSQIDVVFAPVSFTLSAAYPNPFNPSTSVNLSIPEAGHVSVQVYNVMGQLVSTLVDGNMNASDYTFTWDASSVTSGVYLIKAVYLNHTSTQKVMLLK